MKKVYVLGGYGLIGSACIRRLTSAGFKVIGVGRTVEKGIRSNPQIEWQALDIANASVSEWNDLLSDANIIVNAAGALQNSGRDDLDAIHVKSIENLTKALSGKNVTFVQISAAGANENASTEFMRSKAHGDNILINSRLNWVIIRPTLVISPDAYGGTAILRAAAAFPLINVQIFPEAQVQTVSIDDLTYAVVRAANGLIPRGTVADLTEKGVQSFDEIKQEFRRWLGFTPWRVKILAPVWSIKLLCLFSDIAGLFGWRSPLRTTALKALENGITGDTQVWEATGSLPCRALGETLASIPATLQERWFSKLYLMLPLAIIVLAIFWLSSGVVSLFSIIDAQQVLTDRGMSSEFAQILVITGSIADIALGLTVLIRRFSRLACIGMLALTGGYLISSLFTAPDLWLDPLGPMIKVIPSMVLTMFTISILEER